jgi:hypothetical protein
MARSSELKITMAIWAKRQCLKSNLALRRTSSHLLRRRLPSTVNDKARHRHVGLLTLRPSITQSHQASHSSEGVREGEWCPGSRNEYQR